MRDNPEANRFEASDDDGAIVGFIDYRVRGNAYALNHTETVPEATGQGVAGALVKWALDELRAQGREVLPYCPFVRSYIARHREYVDLVPERSREQFSL